MPKKKLARRQRLSEDKSHREEKHNGSASKLHNTVEFSYRGNNHNTHTHIQLMTHTAEAVYIWVSSRSTPTFFLFGGLNAMRYNEIFVSMAWNECENVYNGELCITKLHSM